MNVYPSPALGWPMPEPRRERPLVRERSLTGHQQHGETRRRNRRSQTVSGCAEPKSRLCSTRCSRARSSPASSHLRAAAEAALTGWPPVLPHMQCQRTRTS